MNRHVYLEHCGVHCAAGSDVDAVWRSLLDNRRALSPLPCPAIDGMPWTEAFIADESLPAALNVDRKTLRTMEKQAMLALHGAWLALGGSRILELNDKSRIGLYLGLPVVDDAVPPWCVLEAMHEAGITSMQTELCLHETPTFSALSDLNSSACAHIAGKFGMTGAMGAYSPFADSGLQAVIEGMLSVSEGETDAVLAGGVSPKVNPLLLLQYDHFGWLKDASRIPGEGAAFATLTTSRPDSHAVRISGYARGFASDACHAPRLRTAIARRALGMAGIDFADLDWVLPGTRDDDEDAMYRTLCRRCTTAVARLHGACGELGPAGPVLAIAIALHGMRSGKRLDGHAGGPLAGDDFPSRHVLVTAGGPEGQYAAVVLSREEA